MIVNNKIPLSSTSNKIDKDMVSILALDSSSEYCSVACVNLGVAYTREILQPKLHSKVILSLINEILQEANVELQEIDVLAFGIGPGSFTGLRIAASVVQGLSMANTKPIVGVSTLQAIAQEAYQKNGHKCVLSLLDARKNELYWGLYIYNEKTNTMEPLLGDSLGTVATITKIIKEQYFNLQNQKPNEICANKLTVVGVFDAYKSDLINLFKNDLSKKGDLSKIVNFDNEIIYPKAFAMLDIARRNFIDGQVLKPEEAIPVYIRNDVVEVPKK